MNRLQLAKSSCRLVAAVVAGVKGVPGAVVRAALEPVLAVFVRVAVPLAGAAPVDRAAAGVPAGADLPVRAAVRALVEGVPLAVVGAADEALHAVAVRVAVPLVVRAQVAAGLAAAPAGVLGCLVALDVLLPHAAVVVLVKGVALAVLFSAYQLVALAVVVRVTVSLAWLVTGEGERAAVAIPLADVPLYRKKLCVTAEECNETCL